MNPILNDILTILTLVLSIASLSYALFSISRIRSLEQIAKINAYNIKEYTTGNGLYYIHLEFDSSLNKNIYLVNKIGVGKIFSGLTLIESENFIFHERQLTKD